MPEPLLSEVDEALRAVSRLAQLARSGAGDLPAPDQPGLASVSPLFQDSRPGVTLRLEEAAEILAVSPSTLRRWADAGRIPMERTTGGHRRFQISDVERLRIALHGTVAEARLLPRPTEPAPHVAALLATHGETMTAAAARAVYQGPRHGWFATEAASEPLSTWLLRVQEAFAGGDYACADRATDHLFARAERAASPLIERHLFLERFGDMLARALTEHRVDAAELRTMRRLFGYLVHRHLDAHSRGTR